MKALFLLVFLVVFFQFTTTLAHSPVSYADSDELLTNAYLLSVAHPSGYPVSTLLAGIGMRLIPLPPAHAANLFFAFLISVSFAFFAHTLLHLYMKNTGTTSFRYHVLFTLASVLLISSSFLVWLYASFAENTGLMIFFTLILVSVAMRWHLAAPKDKQKWFIATSLFFGLSLAHKQIQLFMSPLLLGILYLPHAKKPSISTLRRFVIRTTSGIVLALLAFFLANSLLFWFNHRQQPFSWYFPQSPSGLKYHLLRQDYTGVFLEEGIIRPGYFANLADKLIISQPYYLQYLLQHLGWLSVLGVALSVFYLAKMRDPLGIVLGVTALVSGPLFAGFLGISPPNDSDLNWRLSTGVLHRQLVAGEIMLLIFLIYIILHVTTNSKLLKKPMLIPLIAALLIFQVGSNLWSHYPQANQKNSTLIADYTRSMLNSAAPNSVILCVSDISCFSLMYQNHVNKIRQDVAVITKNSRYTYYFLNQNPQYYPFLYQDNPEFYANLVAYNVAKRPTYLTAPENFYIDYIGLSGDPFYLVPHGYLYQVVTTAPEQLPAFNDNGIVNRLYQQKDPSIDYFGVGFKEYFSNLFTISGLLYAYYGEQNQARSLFEHSIGLSPGHQKAKDLLIHINDFEGLPLYAPNTRVNVQSLYQDTLDIIETGDLETAYLYLLKLVLLDPENSTYRLMLADIYIQGGFIDRGITEYRHVLIFDPANPQAKEALNQYATSYSKS